MGCRGVAVLPEGMSQERFDWLAHWVADPADIVRTPGSESNVKEIYDECAELARDPVNVIFNQFSEFGNYLVHYLATGRALGRIVESIQEREPDVRLHAFVSATGSAGTIGAGDALKERFGARIVAVEALECPTMLENGFGEHNIQGIGDKHIPLIHNVMNTDTVVGISDRATDELNVLFNTAAGRDFLVGRRGVPPAIVDALDSFGLSSICNVLAAIEVARHDDLGPDDVIVTVATDGAAMYRTELDKVVARSFVGGFDETAAAEVFGHHVLGGGDGRQLLDLTPAERRRIFNLGYFTWVEQQGVPFDTFVERREPAYWSDLQALLPVWDELIEAFNDRVASAPSRVGVRS
jgi:cysteine synthase